MSPKKEEACTRRAGADDGFSASRCGLSGTANCASAKIGVFNCVTPKFVKRLKTQADEGLTTADEAGYVFLRQPQASKLANLFRIDVLSWNPSGKPWSGTPQKLTCGVYADRFVVRPLHAVSPRLMRSYY